MKKIEHFFIVLALIGAATIQSGCIVGVATQNPYVAVGGAGLFAFGGNWFLNNSAEGLTSEALSGGAVAFTGVILNTDKMGREISLNPMPLDEDTEKKYQTDIKTLKTYNDELNEVIAANSEIESSLGKVFKNDDNIDMAEIDKVSKRMGFEDAKDLIAVIQGDALSQDALKIFANEFQISVSTAELYLQIRWNINIEK